jgi:hypothetical protein
LFAIPSSQLLDYDRIVLLLIFTFAKVTDVDRLAAFVQDRPRFDFVLRATHDPLFDRDRSECQKTSRLPSFAHHWVVGQFEFPGGGYFPAATIF